VKCSISRILISHKLDGERPLPKWVQRHLFRCEGCRASFSESYTLANRLRADSHGDVEVPGLFLAERVLAAVGRYERSVSAVRDHHVMQRWLVAAAASSALIVFGWLFFLTAPDTTGQVREEATAISSAAAAMESISELGRNLIRKDPEGENASLLSEYVARPLAAEVERMSEDAEAVKDLFSALVPIVMARQRILEAGGDF
jgi:hypothetical protein